MQRFFSIVIPAYNEERLIEKTLSHLKNIRYPAAAYEVVVVENGSTDSTLEKAKKFESANFTVFHSEEKGVSRARNFGGARCSPKAEWLLILDADTFLEESFLDELNAYLESHPGAGYGTTTIRPDARDALARTVSRPYTCKSP